MTPTSDERREVAERVRKTRGIMAFVDALGIDVDSDWRWTDVSRRVADLIDPTCKVESVEPIRYGEFNQAVGSAFILSCGHTVMRACTDMPPAFCDECGARVVSDDDE
jgi:hypothetical protein